MNRLPRYDSPTRRAEFGAFLSLGLVGVTLIGLALADSARFSTHRDAIVSALSEGAARLAASMAAPLTNQAPTNLTSLPAATVDPVGVNYRPRS